MSKVDILIYCHDGRGLGHLSRSIAIALAIRRLRPAKRVALLTGSEYVPALAGYGRVDWIKLPSYATGLREVYGTVGSTGHDTGTIRRRMIRSIVRDLKPQVVLVDHYPAGKQDELLSALEDVGSRSSLWFLGLRAVVGRNPGVWGKEARTLVREKYTGIFWYGDSSVSPDAVCTPIRENFVGKALVETGYVSRAEELAAINALPKVEPLDGLAAFTWCSSASIRILDSLAEAIPNLGPLVGSWRIMIGAGPNGPLRNSMVRRLASDSNCEILLPDLAFLSFLKCAQVAVLHAGYNSLTDLVWAGVPSVVIMRNTRDDEQSLHSRALASRLGCMAIFLHEEEAFHHSVLRDAIADQVRRQRARHRLIGLRGAETAALALLSFTSD